MKSIIKQILRKILILLTIVNINSACMAIFYQPDITNLEKKLKEE